MAGEAPRLDAGTIVGLLADDERRRVAAAIVLGATSFEAIVATSAVPIDRAGRALGRLVDAGLVTSGSTGLTIAVDVFESAARDALARPKRSEHEGESAERRKVLDAFVHDGRITSVPAARSKRMVVLDWLVQAFEPGVRYSEPEVNEIVAVRHPDTAMLRRYLVDEGLLDRAGGEYWRSGGTVT
jgi:hypothetical protein